MVPQDHGFQFQYLGLTFQHVYIYIYRTTKVNRISCITLCSCVLVLWPFVAPVAGIFVATTGAGLVADLATLPLSDGD